MNNLMKPSQIWWFLGVLIMCTSANLAAVYYSEQHIYGVDDPNSKSNETYNAIFQWSCWHILSSLLQQGIIF